ncbi:MAG: M48 family metallopeptidase, partial [Deltaproteobacteria bacterium]|nr:M48 family metallopeptidase [Deltaproteobacteria bacterium]
MQVRAEYNDGKRALAHPAVCRFLGDMLEVRSQDGDRLAVWTLDGIRADDPDTVPLRLRHTAYPGERLTVREASAVALLRERLAPIFARHRSRARKRWLLGTVAVWLLLVLGWSGFPLAVNAVAGMIPHGWERTMGEETRATVGRLISGAYDGDVPWRDSGPGFDALQEMVERLAGPDAGAGYRFDVSILDADMVNAFALPGGFIVVTTGLIRRCRTPDELAGVLAHEMAHVTERHNTRRLVRDQFYAFALKL